ncbi:PPC domain-containing DNA-binding protein [Desulfotomaculum copahuensis]|uniref:PPC domain-containing protein n=1 Tax=Desulfotomaculum copahuensis TaxID=1838280 RepID=A0A1B7LH10_9FIRM|nr:PPC domain-containing DNA-binding protein [Desulfotomaculum copahuensis]OAT85495.1 hypothetical protein A6M21_06160 [Desulfotomaculum copahuensis]
MVSQTVNRGRVLTGRLEKGVDLLPALEQICRHENIELAAIQAIGAVSSARVGYYRQAEMTYTYLDFPAPHEIIALQGNVSLKDGRPFVHAHVALMGADGRLVGGHLAEKTIVFACEYVITEYIQGHGGIFERVLDQPTGLYLWPDHNKK